MGCLRSKPEIANYEARLRTLCDNEDGITVGVGTPSQAEERHPWSGLLRESSVAELIRALMDPASTATLSNGRYQICILSNCRKTNDVTARIRMAHAIAKKSAADAEKAQSDLKQAEPNLKKIEVETHKAEADTERSRAETRRAELDIAALTAARAERR